MIVLPGNDTLKAPSPKAGDEKYFLEGPRSRLLELLFLLRTLWEFLRGFRVFHFAGPCIAVFGSARVKEDTPWYEDARKMGAGIAAMGFNVMTGGGPGIMEAASKGASEAGGKALGCNIILPKEQQPNPWLSKVFNCRHFFVRKVLMFKYSYGFVIMPGGMGTMDEFFEALTLIQTHKILNFPVVLMGKDYWEPVMTLFRHMLAATMIDTSDLRYILYTDSTEEALAHLNKLAYEKYRTSRRKTFKRFILLGE
ncbi:LOG family protein [Chitinophaga vietnamensis]|uniref:LOG family protein n=1 Tax=Chitinophaga vietnamensis TaxID=2593957 RepID=UPI0011782ED5|nr:TIGR00730 family Rossman fold protein [Chitinophaga vietnamensis]